ncbi:type II toxin-antitoxin system ParD family antitoxin [soil metagenome]
MPQSTTLSISLSPETLKFVQDKVAKGEYASEEDVINESLEILKQDLAEREQWERDVLIPAHDRFMADRSSGIPADQVIKNLEARRRQRAKTTDAA